MGFLLQYLDKEPRLWWRETIAYREQLGEAEQSCWALLIGQGTEMSAVPPPSQALNIQPESRRVSLQLGP